MLINNQFLPEKKISLSIERANTIAENSTVDTNPMDFEYLQLTKCSKLRIVTGIRLWAKYTSYC